MKVHSNRKHFTQEQKELRKQLAYCLKYLKKNSISGKYWVEREEVEDFSYSLTGEETIESITYFCKENLINLQDIHIEGWSGLDYDDYPEYGIRAFTYRKQTDQEYFDAVCGYLLPTEYQQQQYQEYLRLKKLFEGEGK